MKLAAWREHSRLPDGMDRRLVMAHARFSGYTGRAMLSDVAKSDHGQIRLAKAAMDTTLRDGHRTIASATSNNPNELIFGPDGVDDTFHDRFGIIGRPEHCAERLREIIDPGFTRLYIGTRGVAVDPLERNTHLIASVFCHCSEPSNQTEPTLEMTKHL